MKKRLLLIVIAIAAITVSVAAYYRNGADEGQPRFLTAAVSRGDVVATVEATGTLEAVTTVQVGTQVSGTVKTLYADYNSRVRQGQVVAELEPSLFQTQVDQARATVERLQADVERARVALQDAQVKLRRANELWDRQLIARTDLETAETTASQADASLKSAQAQVTQARASLSQAQVNMNHTIIRAPIDGVVISRSVDVGQTVAASMSAPTLFVIAKDLSEMRVNARIDEADIGRVAAGQMVTFKVDAYPGEMFSGRVSQVRLEPVTEQNVVSYVTIIDVPNRALKLKPGMTANVTIEIARADDALRVPSAALRFRPGRDGARVWVLGEDGQPHPVQVEPGIDDGALTALVGGALPENATVITGAAQASASPATASAGSPLLPRRPGGANGAARRGANR
jgi:HlyD family secretion protein